MPKQHFDSLDKDLGLKLNWMVLSCAEAAGERPAQRCGILQSETILYRTVSEELPS